MKKQQYKLLVWLVVVLLILNISAISTIIYYGYFAKDHDGKLNYKQRFNKEMKHSFFDNDKFTDEEREEFRNTFKAHLELMKPVREEITTTKRMIMQESFLDEPDHEKLDSLIKLHGELHSQAVRLSYQHFQALIEKCDDEQRKILLEHANKRYDGNDHDHRRGRHFKNRK